jgi:hypothetical protein
MWEMWDEFGIWEKCGGKKSKCGSFLGFGGIGIPTAGSRDPEHFSIPIPNPDLENC